jgi:hypothetical protein
MPKDKESGHTIRLNQEIKFLYIKKQKLNDQLCKMHLECTATWKNIWNLIQPTIDRKIQQQMDTYYIYLNKMLNNLQAKHQQQQHKRNLHNNSQQRQFFSRVKKLTNIKLSKEETELLNHGLQYSIEKPAATYITNLTIEAKRAIRLLDTKIQDAYRILTAKKLNQILNFNNHNALHKRQLYILKKTETKTCNGKCSDRPSRQRKNNSNYRCERIC